MHHFLGRLCALRQPEVVEQTDHCNLDLHDGEPHGQTVSWALAKAQVCVRRSTGLVVGAEVVRVVDVGIGVDPGIEIMESLRGL